MRKRVLVASALAAIMIVALGSCGRDSAVGSWEYTNQYASVEVVFFEDGTGNVMLVDGNDRSNLRTTWKKVSDREYIVYADDGETMHFHIAANGTATVDDYATVVLDKTN